MNCPVCLFAGTLQEVRAHIIVQARIDDAHSEWLTGHGIDLDDDTESSVSQLTRALAELDADEPELR